MIVADASGLRSLAAARVLGPAIEEFDVHTTDLVVEALEGASAFHGPDGDGARVAIDARDELVIHRGDPDAFVSSRVSPSQGSCVALAVNLHADALLTDDLEGLPELDRLVHCVVTPPIVLSALVRRGVLAPRDAGFRLEALARTGGWLGRTVYRRSTALLDEVPG